MILLIVRDKCLPPVELRVNSFIGSVDVIDQNGFRAKQNAERLHGSSHGVVDGCTVPIVVRYPIQ